MPLQSIVVIEIGSAIAKAILKVWLKDKGIAADISSSLIDLFKKKTTDDIAARKGTRQLEEMGEKVAESLLSIFETEGFQLDEGDRIEVAEAIAKTLRDTPITPQLLAEKDLDSERLSQLFRSSIPAVTSRFSEIQTTLYRRILSESSQYIIEIAPQLPAFTESTFAEILKRENQLIEITTKILAEVQTIREESRRANPEEEAALFEMDYRRQIVKRLDYLELFGADLSTASRRHRLSIAYVTLSVGQKNNACQIDKSISDEDKVPDEEENQIVLPVDQALPQSSRLLLRGLAGSGKTTLLQWVAVKSATKGFEGELSEWNNTIPFFIRLRQCVQPNLPLPEEFPALVVPAIAGKMPRGWVIKQLEDGRGIVLIDGIDEVPQTRRETVREWLRDLTDTFPNSRFMVTSRPSAIDEDWLDQEAFDHAELQPMEQSDIIAFVEHWHDAVREELPEEERVTLIRFSESIKDVIRKNRPLRNLATNPLLCAMLCALNRDRRQQLPSDRIELYEACCSLLLDRRDIERSVQLNDYPTLGSRQKRALLEDFSYYLIHNGWSEVSRERADQRFENKLASMERLPEGTIGSNVRRLFVERSGIIREPIPGQIDFTHRTFQEFLAAQAALDAGDIGVLIRNAHDDQWREMIILAAGLAKNKERSELIQGLIEWGDQEADDRYQLHLLAVACMETSVEIEPDVKKSIQQRLAMLIPPKKVSEAKALASAGELAVPYLKKTGKEKGYGAVACVRALINIGSESALDALETYVSDDRQPVIIELFKGWSSFDHVEYAERVLKPLLAKRKDVNYSEYIFLAPEERQELWQFHTGLQSLSAHFVSSQNFFTDLPFLSHVDHLVSLDLAYSSISDLSPLASLPNITTLSVVSTPVRDLSPLVNFPKLTTLNLRITAINDLSPLANLRYLERLLLSNTKVTDLSPLASLTNLVDLDLKQTPVTDLAPLAGLNKLVKLNLELTQVTDLSPLINLHNLRFLWTRGAPIKNVTVLSHIPNLHMFH